MEFLTNYHVLEEILKNDCNNVYLPKIWPDTGSVALNINEDPISLGYEDDNGEYGIDISFIILDEVGIRK